LLLCAKKKLMLLVDLFFKFYQQRTTKKARNKCKNFEISSGSWRVWEMGAVGRQETGTPNPSVGGPYSSAG
jgi:hypothetical protein